MLITKISPVSGKEVSLDIPMTIDQYKQYINGSGFVQNIFPELSADQREFLISGCTKSDWDYLFAAEPKSGL
jgi:hypothetical protein